MTTVKPADVVTDAVAAGQAKATASSGALVLRGVLGGAVLAATTSFAVSATVSSGSPVVGAVLFPAGITIVILMGMELVTGGFALTPMAAVRGLVPWSAVGRYSLMAVSYTHLDVYKRQPEDTAEMLGTSSRDVSSWEPASRTASSSGCSTSLAPPQLAAISVVSVDTRNGMSVVTM